MKNTVKQRIFIICIIILLVISIFIGAVYIIRKEKKLLLDIVTKANQVSEYEMIMNYNAESFSIKLNSECHISNEKSSIRSDIVLINDEMIKEDFEYILDKKESVITQNVFTDNELNTSNEFSQKVDLNSLDSGQLLRFFASFLETKDVQCQKESCKYTMKQEEILSLINYLSLITFNSFTDILNDMKEMPIEIIIDTKNKTIGHINLYTKENVFLIVFQYK